ncbi:hypothetical protein JCM10213_003963 [Rhodosporidiobolus nylandii]
MSSPDTLAMVASEERVENDAGRDAAGVEGITGPSPFDRLPDEVVLEILSLAVARRSSGRKLQSIGLSRRLAPLARKAWFRDYGCREEDTHRQAGILQQLSRRRDLQPLLEHLRYFLDHPSAVNYDFAIIPNFTSLSSLTLRGSLDGESRSFVLPAAVTDTFRELSGLRHLEVSPYADYTLQDKAFSVGRDLPRLTSLKLNRHCRCQKQMLRDPMPELQHLDIWSSTRKDDFFPSLRLSTLRSLKTCLLDKSTLTSLQHLEINPPLFPKGTERSATVTRAESLQLLDLADQAGISSLAFSSDAPEQINGLAQYPSVKSLQLSCHGANAADPSTFLALVRVISAFPNLRNLAFEWMSFSATSSPLVDQLDPNSLEFQIYHPTLLTFLANLRRSHVLRFDITHSPETLRWSRATSTEEFHGERYRSD